MFYPVIKLEEEKPFFQIVQIGTGGTGGYVVQRLAKLLYSYQSLHPDLFFEYTLVDGDAVEMKNLQRQPFLEEDLNLNKAQVLANRYGDAYDFPIYCRDRYIEKVEDLQQLFRSSVPTNQSKPIMILIGCVDNHASRKIMNQWFMESDGHMIYLDSGVDSVLKDLDGKDDPQTGYSGHVVCGYRHGYKMYLDPVGGVFPEILEDQESRLPTKACGATVVNFPQRMQSNEVAALTLMSYLNTILMEKQIVSHFVNFNAKTMLSRPIYLTEEQVEGKPLTTA